jgi:hypothetical protein
LVSSPLDERLLETADTLAEEIKDGLKFIPLPAESSGVANLARLSGLKEGSDTVFARLVLDSERDQTKELRFGYSDRVRVFLNGRRLYAGSNDYRSRDYRYLGTIGLFDALSLPLVKGRNELWLAVSESFGGWGVIAALEDLEGLVIVSSP